MLENVERENIGQALGTMRSRIGKKVQRQLVFQNRQCKLCKGAGEITQKKEKMYVKTKY